MDRCADPLGAGANRSPGLIKALARPLAEVSHATLRVSDPPVDICAGTLHRPGLPRFLTSGHAHWQQQSRHEQHSASSSHCESSQRRHTMPIPP